MLSSPVLGLISFGGLVDNALVYIAGFDVQCIFRSLSCDVCRASVVTDAVAVPFDQRYHLLQKEL